jgi:transposase
VVNQRTSVGPDVHARSTLTAFGLAVEIGDWQRLLGAASAPTWAWSLPSAPRPVPQPGRDHQDRQRARPPAADRSRLAPPPALPLTRRRAASPLGTPPAAVAARGHVGNRRLDQRWQTFIDRKKTPVIANAAIARELAGWCWSLAVLDG